MKPNSSADAPMNSGKPKASSTPLIRILTVLVTGPVWIIARTIGIIVSGPSLVAHKISVWAARIISKALGR